MRVIWFTAVTISILFIFTLDAQAYIDPSSGSYFLQILIAGLLGAAFAIKAFWKKITLFLRNLFSGNKDEKQ